MTTASTTAQKKTFDVQHVRASFPILGRTVHGKPLVYLDNAATTQKPREVIDAEMTYYTALNANVHRAVHTLSEEATAAYEQARTTIARYIGARSEREVVFVRGTTEAVNLVASTYGRTHVGEGDEVVISGMEHHSNIVPWQMLCGEKRARLRVIPVTDSGELDMDAFARLLTARTKIVAVNAVSNALGTINPVTDIVRMAKERGIPVLIDGAQAMPHQRVDVTELGCEFFAFSGHKMFGPTGIGVLFGREDMLAGLPPYQGGGDMIKSVTFERTVYNDLPYRFEAGTPNIAGAVGLGAAVEFLDKLDWEAAGAYESELVTHAQEALADLPGVTIIGTARQKAGVVSFVLDGVHPHDIGTILDREGIAIRTGHHCAQPVMDRFGVPATARASFAIYNTKDEADRFVQAVRKVRSVMGL